MAENAFFNINMIKGLIIVDNAPRDYAACLSVAERMNELGHSCLLLPWSTPHSFLIELCKHENISWVLLGQYRRQFAQLFRAFNRLKIRIFIHEFEGYISEAFVSKWLSDISKETGSYVSRYFSWGSMQRSLLVGNGILESEKINVTGSIRHQCFREAAHRSRGVLPEERSIRNPGKRALICFSSNMPTPKMQSRTNEFKMYCELVGMTAAIDNYEIQLQNREHLLSVASCLKYQHQLHVTLRPHPFCNISEFRILARNYGIDDSEVHSPDDHTLYDELLKCDLVVTMGSTSSLEASSLGKPIVNLQTMSKCDSEHLDNFYYSKAYERFCMNANSIPEAIDMCISINRCHSSDSAYHNQIEDPMFHLGSDALSLACKDIHRMSEYIRPNYCDSMDSQSKGMLEQLRIEYASIPSDQIKNKSRFLSRYYLRQYRSRFSTRSFSPSIYWIKLPEQAGFLPVVETTKLL